MLCIDKHAYNILGGGGSNRCSANVCFQRVLQPFNHFKHLSITHFLARQYQKTHDPTPPRPTSPPNKSKRRGLRIIWGGWGLESTREIVRVYGPSFELSGHGKRPETHTNVFFRLCNSNSLRFFISDTRNPRSLFWKEKKKKVRREIIEIHPFKNK